MRNFLLFLFTISLLLLTEIYCQNKVLSSDSGRFVFGQTSEYRQDHFMLDTETGRLWQIVKDTLKNRLYLEPIPYTINNEFYSYSPYLSEEEIKLFEQKEKEKKRKRSFK